MVCLNEWHVSDEFLREAEGVAQVGPFFALKDWKQPYELKQPCPLTPGVWDCVMVSLPNRGD